MKKIIFLVGNYYPRAMANGICVGAIAEELVAHNYEVHVICQKNGSEPDYEEISKVNVHRISPSLYKKVELKRGTCGQANSRLLRVIALFLKLMHIPFYPITSFSLIQRYKKKVCNINENDKIVVVSCFNPMEAVVAGMRLKKNRHVINIGYYLDSLSNEGEIGIIPRKLRDYFGFRWEKKLFENSDAILLMQSHSKHYSSSKYSEFHGKMKFVDIPLYIENAKKANVKSHKVVYAGMLSAERRNPEYACKVISEVLPDYTIEFYGRGDCDAILDRYSTKHGGNVINKGFVSHHEAKNAINDAEVLLSIGNKDSDMIPSKIFEYISTGKKIIHFAYDRRDACIPYLSKYPNGLLINMYEKMDMNITKCKDFFESSIEINQQEISRVFIKHSPRYTAGIIKEYVD